MQLHPLKLGVPPKAQPPGPPPQPVDRAPLSSQRKEPVPPAAYEEILKHQVQVACYWKKPCIVFGLRIPPVLGRAV